MNQKIRLLRLDIEEFNREKIRDLKEGDNINDQFLKHLCGKVGQVLHKIDSLRELITLVECEFERENRDTEEKLDILRGMMRQCEIQFEKVKELIEGMRIKEVFKNEI